MKKRILSIVLAVLMLVSVLPVPAMAATMGSPQTDTGAARQLSVSNATDDDSVHIVKSVNEAGTALTLEAYATNTMTTVTTYEPLDIVLVLDVSGSMDDEIDTYTYKKVENKTKWSCKDIYNNGKYGYYIQKSDSSYQAVSYSSRLTLNGRRYWATAGGQAIGSEAKWDETSYSGELYTRQFEKREKKIVALKRAVNAFIDNVAAQKDSDGNTIDNRISLVTFASNTKTVKGLTKASTGSSALKTAVNALEAGGATRADYGMKRAQSVLDGRTGGDKTRKSVVILFTDGEPTSRSSFESSVASGAITAAKDLKAGGTTIFTVGIFEGANPSASVTASSTSKTNKYMHAVSSNYPSATYEDKGFIISDWTWTFGTRAKDSNYYLAAQNAAELEDIFEAISKEVNSLAVKVDETSVLSDTLSDMFDFAPVGEQTDVQAIKVEKVAVTGKDADGYTWATTGTDITANVNVGVTGKKLTVTGFDYGKNAVTTKTEGETPTYSGYKLVVTIPIKPDTSYERWTEGTRNYDTNSTAEDKRAGLTYGDSSAPQKLELNDSPNAPVTGYTVSYQFKGTAPDGVPEPAAKVYIEGQNYTIETAPSKEGWTFTGWCSDGDCTTTVSGQKPMGTEPVTYYGMWTKEEQPPETATLSYEFKSGDDTITTLPQGVLSQKPADSDEVEAGTDVTLPSGFTEVTDTVNKGKWTFVGWYTDDNLSAESKITGDTYPMPEGGKTLYGKWTFTENTPEPVKSLEVTKTADKQTGKVDEMITYTIEVKNTGDVALENIKLTDTFDGTGKIYKDSNKETEVELTNGVFTESIDKLAVGESKTYIYYYWVQDEDGTSITNAAVARAEDDTKDSTEITTDVDRGDVDGYKVVGCIKKIVESKKGTFKKDASFTFDIWADKDCRDLLGTVTISEEWAATKDWYDEKTKPFFFEISENDFAKLDKKANHKVIYVTEREGDIKGMTYDSDVVTMYLVHEEAAAYSLHIVDHYFATADLSYNLQPAEFTNVYKKPAEKGETIKVGPQLNRDDHVAYIMGYPDGTVQPEGEITRAEACTIFFRLLTDSSRDYYFSKTNDYTDVNAGDWFNNAISTLSNAGIVTGYNDGTFRPNQPITRGEMAKIIANFANLKYGGKTFTDLAGHWSKSYVELAAGNGWIAGYPDGSFRPDQKITRAETVTMINRVLDRVPAKESRLLSRSIMLTFPDNNPGDWYYIAIQEASNSHEYQRSVYETTGDEMWTKLIDNVDWTKLEK